MFVLRLFKMLENQTESSKLEQRSVIKHFANENRKPCEFNKKIYDVYGKTYLTQTMFTKEQIMDFPPRVLVKKIGHRVETHQLSGKVPDAMVSKEVRASLFPRERTHHY